MPCAIVEHSCGKKTHHTNVLTAGLRLQRNMRCVRLVLTDGSDQLIESGIAVHMVDDQWYCRTQLGVNP